MSMLSALAWFCIVALGFVLAIATLVAGLAVLLVVLFGIFDFIARRRRRQA